MRLVRRFELRVRVCFICYFFGASAVVFEDFGELLRLDGRQLFRVQFVQVDLRLTADIVLRIITLRAKRQIC